MPDLLIRDLDPAAHELLKRRAEAEGRSLQVEVRRILEVAARASDVVAARQLADEIRAGLADQPHPDGAEVIRQIRDR